MNKNLIASSDRDSTSARGTRRRGKIRQILEAATEVFLEDGFAATSMDKIVDHAGVSKRTLYSYYGSKEEIYIGVMQVQLGSIWKSVELSRNKSENTVSQLRRLGIELLRIANSPGTIALFRNIAGESRRFPNLAQQFVEENFEKLIDCIAAIIESDTRYQNTHITDAKEAGEYFLDILTGTAYHRVIFGTDPPMSDKTIKARTERALNYLFAGHYQPDSPQ